METKQQQLQVKLKNAPVDASQVHCTASPGLNREETLSVQDKVRACNSLDVNQHRQAGGLKAIVFVNISKKSRSVAISKVELVKYHAGIQFNSPQFLHPLKRVVSLRVGEVGVCL